MKDLLVLHVLAKPDCYFAAYDLLQAITATGMQFGAMNIFHYYLDHADGSRTVLFSLVSSTEPGEFDLDRMGDFSCAGLTLFMDLNHVSNPEHAFSLMLDVADQLAEDLDGELVAANHMPLTDDLLFEYHEKMTQYQTTTV